MYRKIFMIACTAVCLHAPAYAQEDQGPMTQAAQEDAVAAERPGIRDKFLNTKDYAELDFPALFRLHWKTGFVTPDNKAALEEYLQVAECAVYKENYKNDFIWPSILRSTAEYLQKYAHAFPNKFMISQPIAFDRYDPDKEWFSVSADTQYLNVSKMTVADFRGTRLDCVNSSAAPSVPVRAVVILPQPFSISHLPMKADFAREYLNYIQSVNKQLTIFGKNRERSAFVRFYFTITGVSTAPGNQADGATYHGNMDGYEIFADYEGRMPLYSWMNPRQISSPAGGK